MEKKGRGLLPWHFTHPFPPVLTGKMYHRKLTQQLVLACEEEMMFWNQAFGSPGFKNIKRLLQEVHRHVLYNVEKMSQGYH